MVRVRYWMGRQSEAILYSGGDLLRAATTEAGKGVYKEYRVQYKDRNPGVALLTTGSPAIQIFFAPLSLNGGTDCCKAVSRAATSRTR